MEYAKLEHVPPPWKITTSCDPPGGGILHGGCRPPETVDKQDH